MSRPGDPPSDRSAAGGLYESELEPYPLGRFHGRELTAIVRRRRLRIALGSERALRIELGETRPLSIEVTSVAGEAAEGGGAPGAVERIELPNVPSPRVELAKRIAVLWLASVAALWIARRLRAY